MPSYRPDTNTISAASTISGSFLDEDFSVDTMFTACSVEYSINITINGITRSAPVIYPSDFSPTGIINVTLNKLSM